MDCPTWAVTLEVRTMKAIRTKSPIDGMYTHAIQADDEGKTISHEEIKKKYFAKIKK